MRGFRLIAAVALVLSLLGAQTALAATEQDDAGQLLGTAQDATAEGVTSIGGTLWSTSDVDLYKVCLTGGRSFSASTVGGSTLDTQLFLFDGDGLGVYGDDDQAAGVRQSLLPADHAFTPTARGVYYLGVSQWNIDPQSVLGPIFPTTLAGLVGPTERGAAEPLSAWTGSLGRGTGGYAVALTGTEACGGVVDETPPAVVITSPDEGLRVEFGATVDVHFTCSDEGGSGLASCVGSVADGGTLDTSALGSSRLTVTARDNAGNETVVSRDVLVVDETAPSMTIDSPADGGTYTLGEAVSVDYACSDAGSGVESCAGDLPNGAALDTSIAGWHTFIVRARDRAGNVAEASARYHVGYDFGGFLRPLQDLPGVTDWRAGHRVPVRFSLGGDRGLDAVESVMVAEVDCAAGDTPESGEAASLARRSEPVRYRSRSDEYRFTWKTERSWQGSCRQLLVKLNDGSVHRAEVRFVRRWPEFWRRND